MGDIARKSIGRDLSAHPLPSSRHLSSFACFFNNAKFNRNGTCTVVLTLPAEMKDHVIALSDQDGMMLNVTVWETALPDGTEELAKMVGLHDPDD